MNDLDDEWASFIKGGEIAQPKQLQNENDVPEFSDLYISTKTILLYLNVEAVDVAHIFWNIPIIKYWEPIEGVIKKQMKVAASSKEECTANAEKLKQVYYHTDRIIKQIDNPIAKVVKFKDERKVTIGISSKNVMNYRGKDKSGAMFNCVALTFRFRNDVNRFHEIHVKIFNTGKIEIPGVLNANIFDSVKGFILRAIEPYFEKPLTFKDIPTENVLINSNFECHYNINRDALHTILRSEKYKIDTTFDACSYPGVKCKFYFCNTLGFDEETQRGIILKDDRHLTMEELIGSKKYTKVSFMIFRTGGCLIVGNCSEEVLRFVHRFVKNILKDEYKHICVKTLASSALLPESSNAPKDRKRKITVSSAFYSSIKRIKEGE